MPEAATETRNLSGRDLAVRCAQLVDGLRGRDTVLLDLTGVTPVFDYFVIATATNRRQMQAIADEVGRFMRGAGSSRLGTEGYDSESWVLVDFGDIVVHIFSPASRELYDLEHLWGDAKRVAWPSGGPVATLQQAVVEDQDASEHTSDDAETDRQNPGDFESEMPGDGDRPASLDSSDRADESRPNGFEPENRSAV